MSLEAMLESPFPAPAVTDLPKPRVLIKPRSFF